MLRSLMKHALLKLASIRLAFIKLLSIKQCNILRWAIVTCLTASGVIVLTSACTSEKYISGTRSANYVVEGGVGDGKHWNDNRRFEHHALTEKLEDDGIHDPANAAIHTLQEPSEAMAAFPYDRRGGVNWVKAINLGIIQPRADLKGETEMQTLDMDILFKDTGNMPWVRFPHLAHTQWLACSNCHPDIFIPKKGANNPSMDGILAGEHCGRCHDKVAFALWICERCHAVPHEHSPKQWWEGSSQTVINRHSQQPSDTETQPATKTQ